MKISRLKKLQKILNFYALHFEYREPYQIIIDATFCQAALQQKILIDEQLRKYFQGDVKLLTTQCIILEAESLGPSLTGATMIVKKYHVHKCGHEGSPIAASACIKSMTKLSRYIIATQDRNLQNGLRRVPGRALLYLHKATPVLEAASDASKKYVLKKSKNLVPESVENTIKQLKKNQGLDKPLPEESKTKKKYPKNPNPLSCKKKKKKPSNEIKIESKNIQVDPAVSIQRKRKRVKIPTHVKELVKNSLQS